MARPDLPQFAGKAMTGRAIGYPLAALAVPAAWWLLGRRRGAAYPFAVDVLVVLPFLIDMAGNAANSATPALAAEPVTASTSSGTAIPEIRVPRSDSACPLQSRLKSRFRRSGTGSALIPAAATGR